MRRHPKPEPTHTDRLSGIRSVRRDPDERPSREDLAPQGSQLFKIPELPRFLKLKRER
jgi:hypothetical protein